MANTTKAPLKGSIRNIGYAPITYDSTANTVTYGAIKYLPHNVAGGREYTAEPRGDSQKIYADGIAVYGDNVNDGYDVTLTLLSIFDDDVKVDWLNEVVDEESGASAEYADGLEMPYFALIIHEDTADGKGLITIYPFAQVSNRPSDSGRTKESGLTDFTFPEYAIAATARPTDYLTKYSVRGTEQLSELPTAPKRGGGSGTEGGILLSLHNLTLAEDETATLTAATTPAGETVTWTSGSNAVATVENGVVTAKGEGNTIITASVTVDGVTYTDTCTVIVTV